MNAVPLKIHKEGMIPLLRKACPGFRPAWEAHVAHWNGESVAYLIDAFKDGQTECIRAAFETLERFLTEGDPETQEHAVIGFVESVQNIASWQPFGAEAFMPFLTPHSLEAWHEVEEIWKGK